MPGEPMRLLILSDLHVEAAAYPARAAAAVPDDAYDVVVLAGDIHNGEAALRWARDSFPAHRIVQIAGNHEFYDSRYDACLARLRETAAGLGIDFLENDRCEIDGVEFLGCTLWTDFRLFESEGRPHHLTPDQAMQANRRLMADYFAIDVDDPALGSRRFTPADSVRLHRRSRRWLADALARPAAGSRVVVTHHLPSWRSVVPRYVDAVSNAAFASDVDDLVALADLWIHGHTHSSQRYAIGGCTVVSNARGYPSRRSEPGDRFENPDFEPGLILSVAAGRR
ncbi:MAG: metallophosphoesterase family protein [Burkholderiaceae bacterium]